MSIDEKIGWWVTGLPYITQNGERVQSFKRSYIIPPSPDKKKKADKFLKQDIIGELLQCKKPDLSSYFLTYDFTNIKKDMLTTQSYIIPKINGESVYVSDVGNIQSTDKLYEKLEEVIRKSILPRRLAMEDIFSKDDGITAPPLQNTSSRKGTITTIAETNFAGFNKIYIEYKKFMESFDILLKDYRGDPSKQTNTKTYVMCVLFAFSSTLFSFFKSEFILFSKNVASSLGGLLLIVIRFLQFCVGLLRLIQSGREIGRYISDFFTPEDKTVTGFVKALWNSVHSLASFTLSCLSDLAFLCMTHTYLFDIDSSIDGNLRPDLPSGPYFPQNIRYVLGTLKDASSTMWNATKSVVSIFSPYAIGRLLRDASQGVRFAGWYVSSGGMKIVRMCWDKVKSTLNLNKDRYLTYYLENIITSLEGIVEGNLDQAADDLQSSLQSCKSRFQAATAILKAPSVIIALGSLLGGLIGPGVFAGLFGYIAGMFAGLGVAAPPIALAVSVPLMVWMLECLLKLWGTICNFFFYKSCAHKNCRDTSGDASNAESSIPPDPISEIERKLCMQKCWDSGVAGITSISIPFHVLTEMSAILNAANFQYTSSAIEGMRMVDASTQGTWREYLLGKTKTYAYDPAARKIRDFVQNEQYKNLFSYLAEREIVNSNSFKLMQKEIDDILHELAFGRLQSTAENIEKLKYIEDKLTASFPIIAATDVNLAATSLWTLYEENYKKENPGSTFDIFINVLRNENQKISHLYNIYAFMDKAGETIQKNMEWIPENYFEFSKELNERIEDICKYIEKIKEEDSIDESKKSMITKFFLDDAYVRKQRKKYIENVEKRLQNLEKEYRSDFFIKRERDYLTKKLEKLQHIENIENSKYDPHKNVGILTHNIIDNILPYKSNVANVKFNGSFFKTNDNYYMRAPDGTTIKIDIIDFSKCGDMGREIDRRGIDENNIPFSYFIRYFEEKIKNENYTPSPAEIKFIESVAKETSKNYFFTEEEASKITLLDLVENCKGKMKSITISDFKNYLEKMKHNVSIIIHADFIAEALQKKNINISEDLDISDEIKEDINDGMKIIQENVINEFEVTLNNNKHDPNLNTYIKIVVEDNLLKKMKDVNDMRHLFENKIRMENRNSMNPSCQLIDAGCNVYTPEEQQYIRELNSLADGLNRKIILLNSDRRILPENINVFDEIKNILNSPLKIPIIASKTMTNQEKLKYIDEKIDSLNYDKLMMKISIVPKDDSTKANYVIHTSRKKVEAEIDVEIENLKNGRNVILNGGNFDLDTVINSNLFGIFAGSYNLNSPNGFPVNINRADLLKNDWVKHRIETEQLKDEDIPTSYFMRYFKDKVKEGYIPTTNELKFIEDVALSSLNTPFRHSLEEAHKTTVLDLLEECKKETPNPSPQDFKKYLDKLTDKAENIIFADIIADKLKTKGIKLSRELDLTEDQLHNMKQGQKRVSDDMEWFYTLTRDKKYNSLFEDEFKRRADGELSKDIGNIESLLFDFKYKIQQDDRRSLNPFCLLSAVQCSIYTPGEEAYIKELEDKLRQIKEQRKQLESTPAFFSIPESDIPSDQDSEPEVFEKIDMDINLYQNGTIIIKASNDSEYRFDVDKKDLYNTMHLNKDSKPTIYDVFNFFIKKMESDEIQPTETIVDFIEDVALNSAIEISKEKIFSDPEDISVTPFIILYEKYAKENLDKSPEENLNNFFEKLEQYRKNIIIMQKTLDTYYDKIKPAGLEDFYDTDMFNYTTHILRELKNDGNSFEFKRRMKMYDDINEKDVELKIKTFLVKDLDEQIKFTEELIEEEDDTYSLRWEEYKKYKEKLDGITNDGKKEMYQNEKDYVQKIWKYRNDGMTPKEFKLDIIADLDKKSVVGDETNRSYQSILLGGKLIKNANGTYAVIPEKETPISTTSNVGGRGMELSEVVEFGGRKIAADDKTGFLYDITDPQNIKEWVKLAEGDGSDANAGQKSEWMTIKDGKLYVGSHGKVMPKKGGGFENSQQWVKVIDENGKVQNVDWSKPYEKIKEALEIPKEGYVVHEAMEWLDDTKEWVIFPRKISTKEYETVNDEMHSGTNRYIVANEDFSKIEVKDVKGDVYLERGVSSFERIPNTNDLAIIKTVEHGKTQETYLEIVDYKSGEQKLAPILISNDKKFEGILISPADDSKKNPSN